MILSAGNSACHPESGGFDRHEAARANAYMLGSNADWFQATVGTAPDHAVAPGKLVREYQEAGRRVFEYAMAAPMSNDYAFLSARQSGARTTGVQLEILSHPGHEYNLD
jgi:ABC-2 type transport system permease protein